MTYGRFKHFKLSVFRSDISNHNWDFLSSSKDPNELWSEWKSNFLAIADKNVPILTKRVRSQKSPWITADLKKLMHSKGIMKIKAINSNDPHDWACFKGAVSRQSSSFCLILRITRPQSLWNLK